MREQTAKSLALPTKKFKRKLGVKPSTFRTMLEVLKAREVRKTKRGRTPALCLEDQLVLSLSFWREYRTHLHLSEDWRVDERTVRWTIERVESALIESGEFALPGRKALRNDHTLKVVVVDIAESPIERPEKQRTYYSGKKKQHTQKSQVFVEQSSRRILCAAYGKGRRRDFKLLEQSRCAHFL